MTRPIVTTFGVCLRDQVAVYISRLMGVVHYTCARAHEQMCSPSRISQMAWTDCAEIWYVVTDPLGRRFTELYNGVQLHVHTCASFFRISGTAGGIALKFGVWL